MSVQLKARLARPSFKRIRLLYTLVFSGLVITYICLAFLSVPDALTLKKYNLTLESYRWLIFPIICLVVVTWLASIYGSLRFKRYSEMIKRSPDGQGLHFISSGLLILSLALPFSSDLMSIFTIADKHHPAFLPRLTIIGNYVNIVLLGLSFILIARGASALQKLIENKKRRLDHVWTPLFIVASTFYSYFIIIQPIHTPLARNVYFLPDLLLLITVAIPYLYIWYCGLSAAYDVYRYQTNIRGRLYKNALQYLAIGVSMVIVSSVVTEVLVTISSNLSRLHLTPILWVIYGLLTVDATGYILIAVGANKLRRMEEV